MRAIRELQDVISVPAAQDRHKAFKDWADKWLEMLGTAQAADNNAALDWVERAMAEQMGLELFARPGVIERMKRPLPEDNTQYVALLGVIRAEPRGEEPSRLVLPA